MRIEQNFAPSRVSGVADDQPSQAGRLLLVSSC